MQPRNIRKVSSRGRYSETIRGPARSATTIEYKCPKNLIYLFRNPLILFPRIGDEFQQRTVRIAEIDAVAQPLGAEAGLRTAVDGDAVALQMRDRPVDRPVPFEAEIAPARRHRYPRHRLGV